MTQLGVVFDVEMLTVAMRDGLVVKREHPTQPLAILNYTARCQYERGLWNAVTTACRGLIYNTVTGEIVARPFRKFFNYGQQEAPTLDLSAHVVVSDKLDGSLGILYRSKVGHAIATRGTFESDQAQHATALWNERYNDWLVPVDWTLLFEIIYPTNRVVLDYGDRDELVLLGAVENATGRSVGPNAPLLGDWPGPRAEVLAYATLTDALAAPPRLNAEGLVVHFVDSDERVKVKQEDYVALHRIVMGLNERSVWEHVRTGKAVEELLAVLPDEFHDWTGEVAARLLATVEDAAAEVERAYSTILASLPADYTRKDFARHAVPRPLKWALFHRLDGKDYRPGLWDTCYPAGNCGPRGLVPSEDTA